MKSRRAVSRVASIPAPVGGLNGRDAIAEMKETDAVVMDNWFPTVANVSLRNGSATWVSGFPAAVETLMPYQSGVASKLFAASGTAIYDATSSGTVGAAVVSGLTSARFQKVMFGTPGGSFLVAVNGADDMRQYDGTSWKAINAGSSPAITGVATAALINVNVFKQRLWFVEKNSMRIWYLPIQSIAGVASSIDFGSLFKLGGSLRFMATWTVDNQYGMNDYGVFVTSEGEAAIYQGTDPSNAATWSLVGVFRIGRPVGNRGFVKASGDVVMITADGFVTLSKSAQIDRNEKEDAISDKIVNLASTDIQAYGSNFGWEAILHPIGNKAIFNVPTSSTTSYQYVMNQLTNSWCRFTGWNAHCFELQNDVLYYGGANSVVVADTGTTDDGKSITATVLPAFSYFGGHGQKRFTMIRPIIVSTTQPTAAIDIVFDFNTNPGPATPPLFLQNAAALWNATLWNSHSWGAGASQVYRDWYGVAGTGFAAAARFSVQAKGVTLSWQSTDYLFEDGGGVL